MLRFQAEAFVSFIPPVGGTAVQEIARVELNARLRGVGSPARGRYSDRSTRAAKAIARPGCGARSSGRIPADRPSPGQSARQSCVRSSEVERRVRHVRQLAGRNQRVVDRQVLVGSQHQLWSRIVPEPAPREIPIAVVGQVDGRGLVGGGCRSQCAFRCRWSAV